MQKINIFYPFKNAFSLSYILLISLLFNSCKYEDGPAISFISAENRLKGEYTVEHFEKGGQDLTDSLKKLICFNKFIIHKGSQFDANKPNGICGCRGNYAISDNNKKLNLHIVWPAVLLEPLGQSFNEVLWDIKRLSDDEIHLTVTYKNQFIKFNLKQ